VVGGIFLREETSLSLTHTTMTSESSVPMVLRIVIDAVEPQQIIDPTDIIEVAWLNNNLAPGCGQLPRATWTIEPAPEGVDKILIWMSPPDLGVVSWWSTARGYTTLQGIEFNQTTLNNLSDESDIGVLIQVPKDELQWVEVSYGSPLRVNIARHMYNHFPEMQSLPCSQYQHCCYKP
jgi:hypothetical protein